MEENKKKKISTKDMVQIAMFTAVVAVLSHIAIPMPLKSFFLIPVGFAMSYNI